MHFLESCRMWESPVLRGQCPLWEVGLGCKRQHTEQARQTQHPFMASAAAPVSLPSVTGTWELKPRKPCPSLPELLLGKVFITEVETKLEQQALAKSLL